MGSVGVPELLILGVMESTHGAPSLPRADQARLPDVPSSAVAKALNVTRG